jgi:hypothetical protein
VVIFSQGGGARGGYHHPMAMYDYVIYFLIKSMYLHARTHNKIVAK